MAHYDKPTQDMVTDYRWYLKSIINDLNCMVNELHGVRSASEPRNEPLVTNGTSCFGSSGWISAPCHGGNLVRKLPFHPGVGRSQAAAATTTSTGTFGRTSSTVALDTSSGLTRNFLPSSPPPITLPLGMRTVIIGGGKDSSDSGSLAAGTEWQEVSSRVSQETSSSGDPTCDISLIERLTLTNSIWYLPTLTRQGAAHLLRRRDVGTFIVRASSHPDKLAISVRLADIPGPAVEHYLLEKVSDSDSCVKLRLEGSSNVFNGICPLVTHYCQCCDELPAQLVLPMSIATAATRQELKALSHLGQEYWVTYVDNNNKSPTTCPSVREPPPPLPRRSWTDSMSWRSNSSIRLQTFGPPLASSSPASTISEVFPAPAQFLMEEPKRSPVRPQPPPRYHPGPPTHTNGNLTPPPLPSNPEPSMDSPTYYRSCPHDKSSDYEDIWPPSPSSEFTTFRPPSVVVPNQEQASNRWSLVHGNQTDQQKALNRVSLSEEPVDAISLASVENFTDKKMVVVMRPKEDSRVLRPQQPPRPPPRVRSGPSLHQRRSIAESVQKSVSVLPTLAVLSASLGDLRQPLTSQTGPHQPEPESEQPEPDCEDRPALEQEVEPDDGFPPPPPLTDSLPVESWWPLDSSWEWMSQVDAESTSSWNTEDKVSERSEDEETEDDDRSGTVLLRDHGLQRSRGRRVGLQFPLSVSPESAKVTSATVEDLITEACPELRVASDPAPNLDKDLSKAQQTEKEEAKDRRARRVSNYDNMNFEAATSSAQTQTVGEVANMGQRRSRMTLSETGSTVTEFSEPWDNNSGMVRLIKELSEGMITRKQETLSMFFPSSQNDNDDSRPHSALDDAKSATTATTLEVSSEVASNIASTLPANSRLSSWRHRHDKRQGRIILDFVIRLARDQGSTFGKAIVNFIQCTLDSRESQPHIVMRNVRQFMNGIKNYLVKHGEGEFDSIVQLEREKLNEHEFLNLDAILESALHKMVVEPLQKRIMTLFVEEYRKNGSLTALADGIQLARGKTLEELGVKPRHRHLLDAANMSQVHHFLQRLQRASSPLRKLDNFLAAMHALHSLIFQDAGGGRLSFNAEELLPPLAYTLAQCGMIAAEVEAEYMWGLLPPSVLASEGCYYVTTLSSTVQFLKNLPRNKSAPGKLQQMTMLVGEYHGVMRVLIPDELNGNIATRTIPVRPTMTTKDVCRMIAHKFHIPNPQDYSLYKLVNGEEVSLGDAERPYVVKMEMSRNNVDCSFAYKRTDAKIAWPMKSFSSVT